ncbi:hypothetical protein [Burkholderia glumae]
MTNNTTAAETLTLHELNLVERLRDANRDIFPSDRNGLIALIERLTSPRAAVTPETERSDGSCEEHDGCPTEKAVLQRFWRIHGGKLPVQGSAPAAPVAEPRAAVQKGWSVSRIDEGTISVMSPDGREAEVYSSQCYTVASCDVPIIYGFISALLDAAPAAPVAEPQPDDAANLITIDRRDLYAFVRGSIKRALEDASHSAADSHEPMSSVDCWSEAHTRTIEIFDSMKIAGIGEVQSDAQDVAADGADTDEISGKCFIVIGHGESDIPEAKIIARREDLLDAVLGMIYTHASEAPDDVRAEYAESLSDDDEWAADRWSVDFEIGGIVIWRVGLHPVSLRAAVSPATSESKCSRCGSTTAQACNELGCFYLESGNGEPATAEPTDYDAIEREHFGDPDKRTGIYAPATADELAAFLVWWTRDVPEELRRDWINRNEHFLREGKACEALARAWEGWQARASQAAAPQANAAEESEDAYVIRRLSETLADVAVTLRGDDPVHPDDPLNKIELVKRLAEVLRMEVELYRAQAAAPADARELVEMIDNNVESLNNLCTAADEKALTGLSRALRKVSDTLTRCRVAVSIPADAGEAVGVADSMPGANGFTMACFEAAKVPIGTKLYAAANAGEAVAPLSDQDIYDKFSFLEGLVNESTYVQIADTAIEIARVFQGAQGGKGGEA